MVKLRNGWFIYSTYILVVTIDNLSPKLKNKKTATLTLKRAIKSKMASSEYMISDYNRILYLSDNVQLLDMLQVLILLVWIRVGIRILREVKGQHFANDAVSLL